MLRESLSEDVTFSLESKELALQNPEGRASVSRWGGSRKEVLEARERVARDEAGTRPAELCSPVSRLGFLLIARGSQGRAWRGMKVGHRVPRAGAWKPERRPLSGWEKMVAWTSLQADSGLIFRCGIVKTCCEVGCGVRD